MKGWEVKGMKKKGTWNSRDVIIFDRVRKREIRTRCHGKVQLGFGHEVDVRADETGRFTLTDEG